MDSNFKELKPEESLESQDQASVAQPELQGADSSSLEQPIATEGAPAVLPDTSRKRRGLRKLFSKINIYLLLFIILVVIGGVIFAVALLTNRTVEKSTVESQTLNKDTLNQLSTSDVTVGQPKQTLNVQSNAVFGGKVLIRDRLEVAGSLQVGGSLNIPGITVSGNSVFDQVQINKSLSVAADTAFQGQLSIQKGISVAGGGTFGGAISAPQITANTLQLNGDLNITHHITAGGATPGKSNGNALGSGGTTSVSGSDSAGSVNVNTGSGAAAGCFVTVNFTQKFNATPHVLITPVGADAAGINYYVNRSTTNFSVCAANVPPSNASFGFDYFILD